MGLKFIISFCCLAFAAGRTIDLTKTVLSMTEHKGNYEIEQTDAVTTTENLLQDLDKRFKFNSAETEKQQVESGLNTVAFYAYLDHSVKFSKFDTLPFNSVVYNAGNGYNQHTGVFTVPESGTYILSFHFENWRENAAQRANLYVDSDIVAGSIIDPAGSKSTQAGTTVILYLTKGQVVYVKVNIGDVWGNVTRYLPELF